jgi:hypothetical protein
LDGKQLLKQDWVTIMQTISTEDALMANDGAVVTAVDTIQLTNNGNVSLVIECRAENGRPFLRWLVVSVEVLINWLAAFLAILEQSFAAQPVSLARIGN